MSVVIDSLGYCEIDYCTEAYCGGIEVQADGLQFSAIRNDFEKTSGVQWRQRVDTSKEVGLQFLGRIASDAPRGFEFLGENPADFPGGFQFRGVITQEPSKGVQFRGVVEGYELPRGLQWRQRVDVSALAPFQVHSTAFGSVTSGLSFRAARSWTHYQCGPGYLSEEPYLSTFPYLAPATCATGGIQVRARNDVQRQTGVQWTQKIGASKILGVQWRQRIDSERFTGMQFDAIQATKLGFQFRVVIYNATNLRILYQFPSRGSDGLNWTATNTAPSTTNAFSPNNVNTDIVEQVWRSASNGLITLTCDTQVPQGVFLDTLAILNHNFRGGTEVKLERSTNGIIWTQEAELTVEAENMYYIAPSLPLQAYRYWRITMSDNALSYFQVGTIVFGSSVILQGECFSDVVKFGRKQFADKVFTEGHTNVANDRGKKRFLSLEFENLSFGGMNFRNLRTFVDANGTLLKALIIPTPKTPSRFAIFGKLSELPEETHNTRGEDYVNLNLNVDESL